MERTAEDVWKECLAIIQENVSRQSFKTWFASLKAVGIEQEGDVVKLTIQLPSRFYYEWLDAHYVGMLRKTITKVLGPQSSLVYDIVDEEDDSERAHEGEGSDREPKSGAFGIPGINRGQIDIHLNPIYTFARFIEGDCNRLARSAAWAISQQPGLTSFNPFVIYGNVGLGKTHLMQSIGNEVKARYPEKAVLYVSSERFTSEYVRSVQDNRVREFTHFYKQFDLLLVDDIQFIAGKEKAQEEFFQIFNALHTAGKQIVLSADRPPRDIQGIEERLLSRLQKGLSADLQPPELETRIRILQRKAEDDGIDLPLEIIEFIARNITTNVRELEGSLIRLLAHATLHRRVIDLGLAKEVLRDIINYTRINLSIEEIQRITSEYFKIPDELIRAKTRKREIVQARQVAMYFAKQLTQHSLKTIGLHFGGRDPSTVIHANQSVEDQLEKDPEFREKVDEIRHTLELRSDSPSRKAPVEVPRPSLSQGTSQQSIPAGFDIFIDVGSAEKKDVKELFEALAELQRAVGGFGIVVRDDETEVFVLEEEETL